MDNLDEYLTSGFPVDRRDIEAIEGIVRDVAATFLGRLTSKGWPYALRNRTAGEEPKKVSVSTTAMIALSLWKLVDQWDHGATKYPLVELSDGDSRSARDKVKSATEMLFEELAKDGEIAAKSDTYGKNDPTTLSFVAELCQVKGLENSKLIESINKYIRDQVTRLTRVDPSANYSGFYQEIPKGYDATKNAIVPLRVVRAAASVEEQFPYERAPFRAYFEANLHQQLSFSAIPDSRFDPAELAFCLEGLLLVQRDACDHTLFKRVLEVLSQAQEQSAFWRPVKPFMATEKGFSLFPVSVEVANSLLRSCSLFDGDKFHATFSSTSIPLLRRYWQWLRARLVRFDQDGSAVVGWHSEHINETDAVHLWETSQVLEFLLNFRRALQAHIARTTLLLSRFAVREPKRDQTTNEFPAWPMIQDRYEPVAVLGSRCETYKLIGQDFIEGWKAGRPDRFSMLLYGPPGTGKTSVAENIADCLGCRLVTVTVSDFLADGGAQLEARAKTIFEVLMSQANTVVLFDEIDSFLLDRDSKRYSEQDTAFQFMTPGMLTKLNELRRSKRVLFIVATNYENRIDAAIKRTGRIDKKYLVLPPDQKARVRILKELIEDHELKIESPELEESASSALFLGYKDMEGVVLDIKRSGDAADLGNALSKRARTTSLATYVHRYKDDIDRDKPQEEFYALAALAAEVNSPELTSNGVPGLLKPIVEKEGPREVFPGADNAVVTRLERLD